MLRGYELNQETVSTMFRHEEYAEKMIKQTDLFGFDADMRSKIMIRQIISLHHQKEKEREEKDFVEIKSKISERWGNIQKYIYNYIKEIFPCEKSNLQMLFLKIKNKICCRKWNSWHPYHV